MSPRRVTIVAVTCLTAFAVGTVPATEGKSTSKKTRKSKAQKKTVKIGDNYYSPKKLTVNPNSTITWKWPDDTGDTHDVLLDKGPKGVKEFQSESAGSFYSYKKKLKKPGTYKIICTLHDDMKMTITVRKKAK